MLKPLPPFGRRLIERMRKGYRPKNGVNIYASWNMGKVIPHGITFPPEAQPDKYNWSFLEGQEISLINTKSFADYEKLNELAVLLIKSGAKSVGLVDLNNPLQWFVPEPKEVMTA